MDKKYLIVIIASILLGSLAVRADEITYSYADNDNYTLWGAKLAQNYDVAIYLPPEAFQGKKVANVTIPVVKSENITDYKIWLSTELTLETINGAKVMVPDVTSVDVEPSDFDGDVGKITCRFSDPYTITDKGVYVGYSFKVSKVDTDMDRYPVVCTKPEAIGGFWIHTNKTYRTWQDMSTEQGAVSPITVELEGDFYPNAVIIDPIDDIFVSTEKDATKTVTIHNLGTEPVTSVMCDILIRRRDNNLGTGYWETYTLAEPIPSVYNKAGQFTLQLSTQTIGVQSLGVYDCTITVVKVNGETNGCDAVAKTTLHVVDVLPVKRPLMEEFTGTWCGWCPRSIVATEKMHELHPDFICISYHNGDAMQLTENYPNMADGFPMAFMDRGNSCDPYYGSNAPDMGIDELWTDMCDQTVPVNVNVTAKYNADKTVTVNSQLRWLADGTGEYRMAYVLTGDGLTNEKRAQQNYYTRYNQGSGGLYMDPFCKGGQYGQDYVYGLKFNDVALLSTPTQGIGNSVTMTANGSTNTHSYTFNLDDNELAMQADRLHVVAILVKPNDLFGTVINCDIAEVSGYSSTSSGDTVTPSEPTVSMEQVWTTSESLEALGMSEDALSLKGGTVLAKGNSGEFTIAYDDDVKMFNIAVDNVKSVVVNGEEYELSSGIIGNTYPQGVSIETAPTGGLVYQINAKADGWVTLFGNLSSNKSYYVWECNNPDSPAIDASLLSYTLSMNFMGEVCTYTLPFDECGYFNMSLPDADRYSDGFSLRWPEKIWLGVDADDIKRNGFGCVMFPVTSGYSYLYHAQRSKANTNGYIFTERKPELIQAIVPDREDPFTGKIIPEMIYTFLTDASACSPVNIYLSGNQVSMTCSTPDATIYYTLDGSTPTHQSMEYTSPITLTQNCTIKAIATKADMEDSSVTEYVVSVFAVSAPKFSLKNAQLTISCDTPGSTIYYTIGGAEPTESSTRYTGPITLTDNREVKARAYSDGNEPSEIALYIPDIPDPDEPQQTKVVEDAFVDWTKSSWNKYVMGYIPVTNAEEGLVMEWPDYDYVQVSELGEGLDYDIVRINGEDHYIVPCEGGALRDDWGIQAFLMNFNAEIGTSYSFTMYAKAEQPTSLGVNMQWGWGEGECYRQEIALDEVWREVTLDFDEMGGSGGDIIIQMYSDYKGTREAPNKVCIKWSSISHVERAQTPDREWEDWIVNGDAEGEYGEVPCAYSKEFAGFLDSNPDAAVASPQPAEIITEADGNHCFVVRTKAIDPNDYPESLLNEDQTVKDNVQWENQFWIRSPRAWRQGERFRISFRYKASKTPDPIYTQSHKTPGNYLHWQAIGDVNFTTDWQTFEKEVYVDGSMDGICSIAFNLGSNENWKQAIDYYFDDLRWESLKLDEGWFVAGDFNGWDYDEAVELVYDDEEELYIANIGEDVPAKTIMISTRRGDTLSFKSNAINVRAQDGEELFGEAFLESPIDTWYDFYTCANKRIELPIPTAWTISIDPQFDEINFFPTYDVSRELQSLELETHKMQINVGDSEPAPDITFTPANAENTDVVWSVSDPEVVSVSQNGTVTGLKVGTAIVTATSVANSRISDSFTVTVYQPPTGITIDQRSISFDDVNQTCQLTATVLPDDVSDIRVVWTSSDESVATVSDDGLVTSRGEGSCTITVSTADGAYSADCDITVGLVCAKPVITENGGVITIKCTTATAKVYYTIGGADPDQTSTLYTDPFKIADNRVIKAKAFATGYADSETATFTPNSVRCADVVIRVADNQLSMSCETSGVTIYYTMDGSEPTARSSVYAAPMTLTRNCTVKAYAHKEYLNDSPVSVYEVAAFVVATPVFDLADERLTITCATDDAVIYYTTNGDDPTEASNKYTAPIALTDNRVIKARAYYPGYTPSDVAVFVPDGFACSAAVIAYDGRYVSMRTDTPDGVIYYTTDGSAPSADASVYAGEFAVGGFCNIRAIVMHDDMADSPESSMAVNHYCDDTTLYTNAYGLASNAFGWCGKDEVTSVAIDGLIDGDDLAYLATMASLKTLDLSKARLKDGRMPDRALANAAVETVTMPTEITAVGAGIFEGAANISAIIWNATKDMPDEAMEGVDNKNLLMYVKMKSFAPSSVTNVVVNGVAESVTLQDCGRPFHCPQQFLAKRISYTHHYAQTTGYHRCAGWETIALPFDVQTYTHESNGAIAPYAVRQAPAKPFWLYQLTNDGFVAAGEIKANEPYLIAMPNNDAYGEDYILAGDVTFAAENVNVPVTERVVYNKGELEFYPTMRPISKQENIFVLNVGEEYRGQPAGSVFAVNLRAVNPFEAFLTFATGPRRLEAIKITDLTDRESLLPVANAETDIRVYSQEHSLYIESAAEMTVRVYALSGVLVRVVDVTAGTTVISDLVDGFYIVNGNKVIVK